MGRLSRGTPYQKRASSQTGIRPGVRWKIRETDEQMSDCLLRHQCRFGVEHVGGKQTRRRLFSLGEIDIPPYNYGVVIRGEEFLAPLGRFRQVLAHR
jgi:hypothetical protein